MQVLIIMEAFGKIRTWSRIARDLDLQADIVVTAGHLCQFPNTLMPLGIRISKGQAIDLARVARSDIDLRLRTALRSCRSGTQIWIATDNDPEGDVIALDIMRVIVDVNRNLVGSCLRLRPCAITRSGVERALKTARATGGGMDDIVSRAVSGRTRGLTDRWMGATFSRMTKAGCGRVRAGILGMALCWARINSSSADTPIPEKNRIVRDLPETGEITFQARSSAGGLPFNAHISISGQVPATLAAVARRYSGRLIPGHVAPMKSIGAAVAPRFQKIGLFNTGDALAYAARFYGVGPKAAMAGLQSAYMQGRISCPRTESRSISGESAVGVVQAARVCGLRDVDLRYAERHVPTEHPENLVAREGIYPTPRMTKEELDQFKALVLKPIQNINADDQDEIEDLMITLVSRRAFEALRKGALAPGIFHPRDDSDLTPEERRALSDLDWTRADGANMPWGRMQMTGLRFWSLASVVIDGMMIEEIGRSSTFANHAAHVEKSGQLRFPALGALPEPSPEGRRILKALPQGMQLPSTCRIIGEAIYGSAPDENEKSDITRRMRDRINVWFTRMSLDTRTALVDILKSDAGKDGRILSRGMEGMTAVEIDPDLESGYAEPEENGAGAEFAMEGN